jgi:hypothetical protein
MKKSDLEEIKGVINSALETHLASVHEEITDLRADMDAKFSESESKLTGRIDRVGAKVEHIDEKLGAFENHEVDKRLQLEVRVDHLEKHRS